MSNGNETLDRARFREQVRRYQAVHCYYIEMAQCLGKVLPEAGKAHELLLIVQSRAKDVASFAEKIQRTGKHYTDPLTQLSDLCGARVIAHTLGDVEIVRRYIEQHFEILLEESDNTLLRLKDPEFGYLSWHYEVRFKPGVYPESVVPLELIDRRYKAEIQVRTILQHAWADIAHDASYKSSFELPRVWKREQARLAAVLEAADAAFDNMQRGLKEYTASYGVYYDNAERLREIDKASIALEADPDNAGVAHRIAKMAMSLGDWKRVIDVLQPFSERANAAMLRDLGVSICQYHQAAPEDAAYARGQDLLERATQQNPLDVDAWASLGGTWRTRQRAIQDPEKASVYRDKARTCYRRAFEVDASDSYALGNFIEYELAAHPEVDIIPYFRPALERAVLRCRAQIEVGVNMPWAYFDLGKFQLMLNEPYAALSDYARGVAKSSEPAIRSALKSFDELEPAQSRLPGFDWIKNFLSLALSIRFGGTPTEDLGPPRPLPSDPVIIIAGYTNTSPLEAHRALLSEAFAHTRGTIISGGTRAGICEVVGELQANYPDTLHTIGYVPRNIPSGIELDKRYQEVHRSPGTGFSPMEILLYWRDIYAAGLTKQAKLVAVGGGCISAIECLLALAFEVPVGIVAEAGGEPSKLFPGKGLVSKQSEPENLPHKIGNDGISLQEFLAGRTQASPRD